MKQLYLKLDPKSRAMLEHLILKHHAPLHELARAAGLKSHMEALRCIREIINPLGRRVLGKDLLSLKQVLTDPLSGEVVTYHWWLEYALEPLVEIADLENEVVISVATNGGVSFSGDASMCISENRALVRIYKGGSSGGHQDR